jgi:hypothetical protein
MREVLRGEAVGGVGSLHVGGIEYAGPAAFRGGGGRESRNEKRG